MPLKKHLLKIKLMINISIFYSWRAEREGESIGGPAHTRAQFGAARPEGFHRRIGDQPGAPAGHGARREAQFAGGARRAHGQHCSRFQRHCASINA